MKKSKQHPKKDNDVARTNLPQQHPIKDNDVVFLNSGKQLANKNNDEEDDPRPADDDPELMYWIIRQDLPRDKNGKIITL